MLRYSRRQMLAALSVASFAPCSMLWAQKPGARLKADPDRRINTQITVELLTREGVGLDAQEWAEIFQDLNVAFSVKRSLLNEKPETTETTSGVSLRDVLVVGRLEKDGSVTFSDRRFTTADGAKIRDWINGLKAYGAQGSPHGKAMWGLSKSQFEPLFGALSVVLKTDPQSGPLNKALDLFTVRSKYPFRFSADATEHLESDRVPKAVERSYGGLSEGAALAAMLNEFGLGFHPQRTPSNKLELAFIKLASKQEVWPVGWPLEEDPPKVAPELFKSGEVELNDEPLMDVLLAVGDLIKIPVLFDEYRMKADGIDIKTFKVSHKRKKTLWSAALKHVCFQARVKWELRSDEAGHPLLWVMSAIPPKEEPKTRR
jgi:hypothetical protein